MFSGIKSAKPSFHILALLSVIILLFVVPALFGFGGSYRTTAISNASGCTYHSSGGPDNSGWWCWTVNTSTLTGNGLPATFAGAAQWFGVCPTTLEWDNGYVSNNGFTVDASISNGEVIAIPNGKGCTCSYQSTMGADASGWWCKTITNQGTDDNSVANWFGVNALTLEYDNGVSQNTPVTSGEVMRIPNHSGAPVPSCSYHSSRGPDGSGWWCYTVNTNQLAGSGEMFSLSGAASYFGVCASTLESDNGYSSDANIGNGEIIAVPNGSGCSPPPHSSNNQTLAWIFADYSQSVNDVYNNPGSFSIVSLDYDGGSFGYWLGSGGTFNVGTGTESVSGQSYTIEQLDNQIQSHGFLVYPIIYGTDTKTTNCAYTTYLNQLLSSNSAQSTFISKAVSEAVNSHINGYNIDFEPGCSFTNSSATEQFTTFANNFGNALHKNGMKLTIDVYQYLSNYYAGGDFDFTSLANSQGVDLIIMEDYQPTYSAFVSTDNFMQQRGIPISKTSIGFGSGTCSSGANNCYAGQDVRYVEQQGISLMSVWPWYNSDGSGGSYLFLDPTGMNPSSATWYSLMQGFIRQP